MALSDLSGNMTVPISKGCSWSWEWVMNNSKDEFPRKVLMVSFAVMVIVWYKVLIKKWNNGGRELPPGPRGLPLVGSLPFLDSELHRYYAKLAQTYGPIMSLRLGRKLCVVVSSSSLAKEVLKDHDTIFANRDVPVAALAATYGGQDMVWSPYDSQWRMLRKVCVREMLNSTNLNSFTAQLQQEVHKMLHDMYARAGTPINIREKTFEVIFSAITSMLWGGTHKIEKSTAEFRQVVEEIVLLLSKPNISDLFPILARFDIQGVVRKMRKLSLWLDQILDTIIDQTLDMDRSEEGGRKQESRNFLQVVLRRKEDGDPISITQIKGLLTDFVSAGNDTTATALEWAVAELIDHPEAMRRAQEELDQVLGMSTRVEETHLSKLHYLSAVVKEVMRLHPGASILLSHCPSQSCVVGGYMVPKGAQVLVNLWAIQTDPEAWDNPLEFNPERFLMATNKCDYSGNDLRYLPFGSGRRICAGLALAERLLMYTLASLLHSFDWRLPDGTKMDLSDKFGMILKMETPLVAIPTPRLSNLKLYT
ncbi:cytochrome P450 monooxygenase 76AD131-like [Tasmannia lanceolata]|uniref:cytochrome P450 monooxygenase 76AD131-like n=1 Tax=Tasmannia lanceolata TaxID=3420 RepID=UPI004062A3CA